MTSITGTLAVAGSALSFANDVDAVGVVDVELAVDEHEIELAALQLRERIVRVVDLHDLAIEIARQIGPDRGMIRDALTNIEDTLFHRRRLQNEELTTETRRVRREQICKPLIFANRPLI